MAGVYDFTVRPGTALSRPIVWNDAAGEPVDLTGKTARLIAKVRRTDIDAVIDLSDEDGLTLGTTNGMITVTLSALETLELKDSFRYAVYELYVGDVLVLTGEITLAKTNKDAA